MVGDPFGDMHQGVQSHHVAGPKRGALGPPHGRACEFVHGFHSQPHVFHSMEKGLDGKDTDAVGNEGWGVFAEH